MTTNYHISRILKDKTIREFLQERGIYPVRKSRSKWLYHCPIHSGDNDPSFIVYPPGEGRIALPYETYYCFGCHSGLNILNLKSDLDGVSLKDSATYFLKDISIEDKDVRDSIIDEIQSGGVNGLDDAHAIEMLVLILNTDCRRYLEDQNNTSENNFFDNNVFPRIDTIARSGDYETLDAIYERFLDDNVFHKRVEKLIKEKEEEELSAVDWRI